MRGERNSSPPHSLTQNSLDPFFFIATRHNTIKNKTKEKESRAHQTCQREKKKTKKRRREEFVVGIEDHLRAGHHTLRCKK